jgi:hypothetical protein
MTNIIKKRYDLQISSPERIFSQTFELDKNIISIKGILLTSNKDDLLYYRGSQRIEINKFELFPENYESKLLMSGINLSPSLRYYDLGTVPVGNGQLKVEFKDSLDSRTFFEPYRVTVYLSCEQSE